MANTEKKSGSIISMLAACLLGLMMIIWPNGTLTLACRLAGIALMVVTAYLIFDWFKTKSRKPSDIARLAGSCVLFLVGLWIMINPETFKSIIKFIVGIALIVWGAMEFCRAYKNGKNIVSMIIAGLSVVLGILIVAVPFATEKVSLICIGIALLYTGVTGILSRLNIIK